MEHSAFAVNQSHRAFFTPQRAYPASQAESRIHHRLLFTLRPGRIKRMHFYSVDGAGFGALSTAGALVLVAPGDVARGYHRVGVTVLADARQCVATALTAVADEGDVSLHVVAAQN